MAVNFTVTNVKTIADGKHADAKTTGLYLWVRNDGASRVWQYRYTLDGKPAAYSIGSLKSVTLADARDKATELRASLNKGENPKTVRPIAPPSTFKQDTQSYYSYAKGDWKSSEHAAMWLRSMELHVFPHFGDKDTGQITVTDIKDALGTLWVSNNDTASRVLGRVRSVLDHAIVEANGNQAGRFPFGNVALSVRFPKGHKAAQVPHPSVPHDQAPALYKALEDLGDDTRAKALRFLLLCCSPRAAEITGAKWTEIEGDMFNVPAERMKSGKGRTIPLSKAAQELLADMPRKGDFIFSGRKGKWVGGKLVGRNRTPVGGTFVPFSGHMHHDGMLILLKEMKKEYDVHGMRACFRGWVSANDPTLSEDTAAELCLDHTPHNQVRRVYDRGNMIDERRALAEKWAAYLTA